MHQISYLLIVSSVLLALPDTVYGEESIVVSANAPLPVLESFDHEKHYPKQHRSLFQEARVLFHVMVDRNGKPHNPMVLSTTHGGFVEAATNLLLDADFQPATLGGDSVEASVEYMVVFLPQGTSASSLTRIRANGAEKHSFFYYLKRFDRHLKLSDRNQQKLLKWLKRMSEVVHESFIALPALAKARYDFAVQYGSDQMQIDAIQELLLAYKKHPWPGARLNGIGDRKVFSYFQDAQRKGSPQLNGEAAEAELIRLLLAVGRYGEALQEYDKLYSKLASRGDPTGWLEKTFDDQMEEISLMAESGVPITNSIRIGDSGYTYLKLISRSFRLIKNSGEINTLNFRCDRQFKSVPFMPGVIHNTLTNWGECYIEIIGKSGSQLTVVQNADPDHSGA
ncbi:MAG: energy transducer TonB [Pseudomonadota bacterium]